MKCVQVLVVNPHQRAVSNCHVVIEADEDGATIHDRGSANGKKLMGKKLQGPCLI